MLDASTAPADRDPAAIWDDQTGETFGQAAARFATFGPALTAAQVAKLPPTTEVWTFGYGDDPEAFTTMEAGEVAESVREDGAAVTDAIWGPFALESEARLREDAGAIAAVLDLIDSARLSASWATIDWASLTWEPMPGSPAWERTRLDDSLWDCPSCSDDSGWTERVTAEREVAFPDTTLTIHATCGHCGYEPRLSAAGDIVD